MPLAPQDVAEILQQCWCLMVLALVGGVVFRTAVWGEIITPRVTLCSGTVLAV